MTDDGIPEALDALLARSAPPASAPGAELDEAIGTVLAQAGVTKPPSRRLRWTRRSIVLTAIGATVVLTGGALAVEANGLPRSEAWLNWMPGVLDEASIVEWQVTTPDGKTCVNEIVAMDMSSDDFASAAEILRHPHALIEAAGGKTRDYFFAQEPIPGVDRDTIIDLAYNSVEHKESDAGRGTIREEDLEEWSGSVESEAFNHVEMRLVLFTLEDMLAAQGIDAEHKFTPDTACVVSP